ncbi:hypothetical protein LEMLEM_LOCUS25958 [Lemmus lemmus]
MGSGTHIAIPEPWTSSCYKMGMTERRHSAMETIHI